MATIIQKYFIESNGVMELIDSCDAQSVKAALAWFADKGILLPITLIFLHKLVVRNAPFFTGKDRYNDSEFTASLSL